MRRVAEADGARAAGGSRVDRLAEAHLGSADRHHRGRAARRTSCRRDGSTTRSAPSTTPGAGLRFVKRKELRRPKDNARPALNAAGSWRQPAWRRQGSSLRNFAAAGCGSISRESSTIGRLRQCRRVVHLAAGAPVQQPGVLAESAHLDGVATSGAALAVAAVDRQATLGRGGGDARRVRRLATQHGRGRRVDELRAVGRVERRDRGERVHLARPQHLAAVHVADAAGDVLVEQHLGDRRRLVVVVVQPVDALVEIGIVACTGRGRAARSRDDGSDRTGGTSRRPER